MPLSAERGDGPSVSDGVFRRRRRLPRRTVGCAITDGRHGKLIQVRGFQWRQQRESGAATGIPVEDGAGVSGCLTRRTAMRYVAAVKIAAGGSTQTKLVALVADRLASVQSVPAVVFVPEYRSCHREGGCVRVLNERCDVRPD